MTLRNEKSVPAATGTDSKAIHLNSANMPTVYVVDFGDATAGLIGLGACHER